MMLRLFSVKVEKNTPLGLDDFSYVIDWLISLGVVVWLILELHWIRVALEGMVGK